MQHDATSEVCTSIHNEVFWSKIVDDIEVLKAAKLIIREALPCSSNMVILTNSSVIQKCIVDPPNHLLGRANSKLKFCITLRSLEIFTSAVSLTRQLLIGLREFRVGVLFVKLAWHVGFL